MILGSYNSETATGGVLEKGVLNPIMNGGNFLLSLSLSPCWYFLICAKAEKAMSLKLSHFP